MNTTDPLESTAPGMVWGKTLDDGTLYPLRAHLLDTAAFAVALWDAVLSVPVKEFITSGLSFAGPGRSGFAFIAASHDCGKADPWFQSQVASRVGRGFSMNTQALTERGLPSVPEPSTLLRAVQAGGSVRRLMRHEATSAAALSNYRAPSWVGSAVSGHHGHYPPDAPPRDTRPVARYRSWLEESPWGTEQRNMLAKLADTVGWPGFPQPGDSEKGLVHAAMIPLITGLICLADWSASDEEYVRTSPLNLLDRDPQAYLAARIEQATSTLPTTIGIPARPTGSFTEVFPGLTPDRAVQQWALAHSGESPRLTIISVPMGEGKTETALWMHSASTSNDGLVFALPTMATADAMFARVQTFYAKTPALAALRHGHALLNSFYSPSATVPVGICDEDGGLTGSEWLSGRHRSLTAPVTVSSCDQVLAAAVNHKFLPVRLASLAGKHVILDEVHTYDAYQDVLLTRLLGWLGRFGTRVTLLSATLPTRRAAGYAAAYAAGGGFELSAPVEGLYPCVTSATPLGVVEQSPVAANRSYLHGVNMHNTTVESIDYAGFREEFAGATGRLVMQLRRENPAARIGVIVNTVDRAIAIARNVAGEQSLIVMHARMTAAQRAARAGELLTRLGPRSPTGPVMMIATQVAEASLDIDVDILVTDLAPVTSLLQRMGRQWRHSQPVGDTWTHSAGRSRPGTGPTVHVLVARETSGSIHRYAAVPYAQAEIDRVLSAGLLDGRRSHIAIPADLQRLVDECDITMDDLTAADTDQPGIASIITLLGSQASDASSAARAGTDVTELEDAWRLNPVWDSNPALQALTTGSLWNAESVTRLRDGDTVQLLVFDQTGRTAFAYPSDPLHDIEQILTRAQVAAALGCVVAVNGGAAARLREELPVPPGWDAQPSALLRSVLPVSVDRLTELGWVLDAELGLTRE